MSPTRKTATANLDPDALAKLVNQEFGEGTMRFASDPYFDVEKIPTGVLSMDWALGGGLPRGRHVEIFGPYAVGKTWFTFKAIAAAQRQGLQCGFIAAEPLEKKFAALAGVDIKKLAVHQQVYGQKCIDMMETWLQQGYGIVALDSIASLLPKSEQDASMDASSMGMEQAKMMSKALRKLTPSLKDKGIIIFINQLRDNVGVMFGPRDQTTGGRAMSFYASVRIQMSRSKAVKKKTKVIDPETLDEKEAEVVAGHRVLVKIEKGKVTGTYTGTQTSFLFDYGMAGADPIEDLMYLGRTLGLVHKKGSNWWIEGHDKQASRGKFKAWLRKNDKVQSQLEKAILKAMPT